MIESLHVDPGTLHEQLSKVLVAAFTDPQSVGLTAGAVLLGYQAH